MSGHKYWKYFERRVALLFGGTRVIEQGHNAPDVLTSTHSIECKSMASLPQWIKDALDQAERNCRNDTRPLVVMGEKNGEVIVVQRASNWLAEHDNR